MDKKPVTKEIVDYAMKITSKDVRAPKCVRDGIVKKTYTEQDMIDAIIYGSSLTTSNVKLYAHNYIKLLNKQ